MKKNILLFIGILCLLVLPKDIFAEEYTFEIGNGKEWNESNIDQLSNLLYDLNNQDMNDDHKVDNKYIFNFADGDYDYSDFWLSESGDFELNFGVGSYRFSTILDELNGSIVFRGKGIEQTHLNVYTILNELYGHFVILDMTIDVEYPYFETCGNNGLFEYGFTDVKLGIFLKNIVINSINNDYPFEFNYMTYNNMPYIDFDNVTINGNNTMRFIISSEFYTQSKDKFINIKNSDLSGFNIYFEGYGERYYLPKAYFENTKLNKLYAYNMDVDLDCNCTFKNGLTKGKGTDNYEDVFDANQYTLYEYYEDGGNQNGKITTSICKNKIINIKDNMSLEKIREELGLEIDDEWTMDPEGIVEIKDGKIVPLKVGKTIISKEINGEKNSLIINVVEDSITTDNNIVVNPKTSSTIKLILVIVLSIVVGLMMFKIKKKAR